MIWISKDHWEIMHLVVIELDSLLIRIDCLLDNQWVEINRDNQWVNVHYRLINVNRGNSSIRLLLIPIFLTRVTTVYRIYWIER